jgi:hypothetical protein
MRVVCVRERPTPEEFTRLGPSYSPERTGFGLEEGREYLVLFMEFFGGILWVSVDTEPNAPEIATPTLAPLFLFRISDSRLPSIWMIDQDEFRNVLICPPTFRAPHYIEDFVDGDARIREDYWRVLAQLRAEDEA